tara:strand:+ start:459 stop:572 length:114 start_codon:yes stop_codon:yes gene_type:complete
MTDILIDYAVPIFFMVVTGWIVFEVVGITMASRRFDE